MSKIELLTVVKRENIKLRDIGMVECISLMGVFGILLG